MTLFTDAPVDNQGKGAAFSPTDLVATALATCMATTMGIVAKKRGLAIEGTRVHIEKHMSASPPRRIARLVVRLVMPEVARSIDAEGRQALEHAAHTCPVRLSLHDTVEVPVEFAWT
jgi:uncharacterized OsmC-like protein